MENQTRDNDIEQVILEPAERNENDITAHNEVSANEGTEIASELETIPDISTECIGFDKQSSVPSASEVCTWNRGRFFRL